MLYIADEVFFTGSAAEITPIRSVDKIQVGEGKRGPVTRKLQERFFGILDCTIEDKYGWLDFVYKSAKTK
jgi:branched-chain amino acid aminotransferase